MSNRNRIAAFLDYCSGPFLIAFIVGCIWIYSMPLEAGGINNPGVQQSGAVTANHCTSWGPGTGQIQDSGAACATQSSGANPTATAGPAAVNGAATTFMRSDAAPPVQVGSATQEGILQCGAGIACTGGIASAAVGANPTATAGASAVNGSATTFMRSDAAPPVAATTFGGQSVAPGQSAVVQGNGGKVQLSTGAPVSGNCAKFDVNGNVVDNGAVCGGAAGANPSATAGPAAVNGVATTFMRSDAAAAVQAGTNAQEGIIQADGTSFNCAAGTCNTVPTTKALSQTGTDNNVNVKPAHQQDHDSAAKAWVYVTQSAGTYTAQASYNASISKIATGQITVTWTTPFASVNYATTCFLNGITTNSQIEEAAGSRAAGSIVVDIRSGSSGTNFDSNFSCMAFGRQ